MEPDKNSAGNAAIYFLREAYEMTGKALMGREVANAGLLQAWVRHADVDRLYGFAPTGKQTTAFLNHIKNAGDAHTLQPLVVPFHHPDGLAEAGAVFHPGPNVAPLAWTRRRFEQRNWSIVGVTHTTSIDRVMQVLGHLLVAPMQPWDALVCPSTAVKAMVLRLLSNYGGYLRARSGGGDWVPAFEMPVIPFGIDAAALDPLTPAAASARAAWRARLNIRAEDIAILWVGRLTHAYKANPWPMYLAAERVARDSGKRIHLVEAGWFPNSRVRAAFNQAFAAAAPSVTRHLLDGRDHEVRRSIWFACDIFYSLVDNIQETFGLTPVEAMAAGLPVIVSDWDGYRDAVRDGVDGIRVPTLVPPAGAGEDLAMLYETDAEDYVTYCFRTACATAVDVRVASEALNSLAINPHLRALMGASGRRRATQVYDWPKVIRQYQALLRSLTARRASQAELCARGHGAPANPLRDDPFRSFEAYPTRCMLPTDRVRIMPGSCPSARAHELLNLDLFRRAGPIPRSLLNAVLRGAQGEGASVASVMAQLPKGTSHALVLRVLGWLVKSGLAAIEPDKGPGSRTPRGSGVVTESDLN
jgi:glycosyltransferase involved in cell wall biosynthesis